MMMRGRGGSVLGLAVIRSLRERGRGSSPGFRCGVRVEGERPGLQPRVQVRCQG